MATEESLKAQGLWDYERDQPLRRSKPVPDETLGHSKPDLPSSNTRSLLDQARTALLHGTPEQRFNMAVIISDHLSRQRSSHETKAPPRCSFGGSYGRCELENGHDGPHEIPRQVKTGAPRCEAQSPGFFSKRCDLSHGHDGSHVATKDGVTDKWPSNPPLCPTCKTELAFEGDVCGLCFPVAQP
jgi:hypothetical protein